MKTKNLILFCARYNQASKNKDFVFNFPYTKNVFEFLFCLERNRLIQTYKCALTFVGSLYNYFVNSRQRFSTNNDSFLLKIYPLYYSSSPLFHHLSYKSTKKQVFSFSRFELAKFLNSTKSLFSPLLILDTTFGLMSHSEALKKAVGGRLVCILLLYY